MPGNLQQFRRRRARQSQAFARPPHELAEVRVSRQMLKARQGRLTWRLLNAWAPRSPAVARDWSQPARRVPSALQRCERWGIGCCRSAVGACRGVIQATMSWCQMKIRAFREPAGQRKHCTRCGLAHHPDHRRTRNTLAPLAATSHAATLCGCCSKRAFTAGWNRLTTCPVRLPHALAEQPL